MKQDTDTREVGSLVGFTFRDWWRVLRDNRFAVSRRYWRRWMPVTLLSLRNSRFKRKEDEQFGEEVEKAETKPPLFVLGHWRSGTTLLHSLLIQDERFTYPNLFQVTFPHIFLSMAEVVERQMAREEAERRAMDNVQVTYNSPGEDEFALAVLSLRSPTLAWMFPRREQHYDRYLTFQDVSAEEVAIWKASFIDFLKKLACCDARPPVLKSPPHTARIRLLLEMFPDARFVHISRHPHQVFRST
ncbi:MAG TPA: sulfotransferase, partial [Caldilineae bacterium]|nr:sulfotransferase [Caldilineae bacterium]